MRIGITEWGSISALGVSRELVRKHYQQPEHFLQWMEEFLCWGAPLQAEGEEALSRELPHAPRVVRLALVAARLAVERAGWQPHTQEITLNMASARGATDTWERAHSNWFSGGQLAADTSPSTTLGGIGSTVSQELGLQGYSFGHSITCSGAAFAIANAVAWLRAGMATRILAGGAEAPLTAFTVEQMKALRIYSREDKPTYPCRALDVGKRENTMVLGEGAACFALETEPEQAQAWVAGLGYGQEPLPSAAGMQPDGQALQRAMRKALDQAGLSRPDVIIPHAPGTRKGDRAERAALQALFGENIPPLASNKWKIGHTLGASGALSLELALLLLRDQAWCPQPGWIGQKPESRMDSVLVNAAGFGGQAVSILLKSVNS